MATIIIIKKHFAFMTPPNPNLHLDVNPNLHLDVNPKIYVEDTSHLLKQKRLELGFTLNLDHFYRKITSSSAMKVPHYNDSLAFGTINEMMAGSN
jgi:hypothetical protein